MREMGTGDVIVAGVAGLLGGFAVLLFTDFAVLRADWCAPADATCLRDWIGALSGWAAAAAAGLTVAVLLRQLKEARRQSQFLLRETLPTLDAVDPPDQRHTEEAFEMQLSLTNWNRHPLAIHDIDIEAEDRYELHDVRVIAPHGGANAFKTGQLESRLLFLDGWQEDSGKPPVQTFRVAVGDRQAVDEDGDYARARVAMTFIADVTLLTPEPQRLLIKARSPFAVVF